MSTPKLRVIGHYFDVGDETVNWIELGNKALPEPDAKTRAVVFEDDAMAAINSLRAELEASRQAAKTLEEMAKEAGVHHLIIGGWDSWRKELQRFAELIRAGRE